MRQKKMQCKDLPTAEVLFAMWAWHEEVRQINADRDPWEIKVIDLERDKQHPADVVKVMQHLYGAPEKLVWAKLDKLERKGLIEYGVTIRLGWPTEKGLQLLQEAGYGLEGPSGEETTEERQAGGAEALPEGGQAGEEARAGAVQGEAGILIGRSIYVQDIGCDCCSWYTGSSEAGILIGRSIYVQDVGCGCCSWYTGSSIDKDHIGAMLDDRLVLGRAEDQDS